MQRKAFTLIELIMAMAIVAIISLTVVVSFSLVDRKRLEVGGRSFAADMIWVRQSAVSKGIPYFVVFDTGNNSYTVYRNAIAAANTIKRVPLDLDLVSVRFPRITGASSHTELDLTPPEIKFDPSFGTITRSDGTPISNINTGTGNPTNVLLINVTRSGRSGAVTFFAESGFVSYKPEYSESRRCFIATAAYQEKANDARKAYQVSREVRILQEFRDRNLATNPAGKATMELYYLVSPALARYIQGHWWARQTTRVLLRPTVWAAQYCVHLK